MVSRSMGKATVQVTVSMRADDQWQMTELVAAGAERRSHGVSATSRIRLN
jgi:hypothetical protein